MKNSKEGFIVPLLLIIGVLVIGGGAYYYQQNKNEVSPVQTTNTTEINVQKNSTPTKTVSSSDNKYLIKENIADLKFTKSEINTPSCPLTKFSDNCEAYTATYQGSKGEEFAVFVEIPNKPIMSLDEFTKEAKRELFKPGDYLDQFYFMKVSGKEAHLLWISNGKFIGIKTNGLTSENGDYIEDLLSKYLPKYPSELKLP